MPCSGQNSLSRLLTTTSRPPMFQVTLDRALDLIVASFCSLARAWRFGCRAAALLRVEPDDLGHRRGVLRALVRVAEADEAREAQRIAALALAHPARVQRAARDLVGQHLDHHLRLDPGARR